MGSIDFSLCSGGIEGNVTEAERGRALRQEGHVYRESNGSRPPSVRRAMFIESRTDRDRPPSGGPCL